MVFNDFLNILFYTFLLTYTCSSELVRVELKPMKSALHNMLEAGIPSTDVIKNILDISNDTIPLFRYLDSEFYGEILIGHPGQKFNVIFDTAWANSWVPSALCPIIDVACEIHNKYKSSKSSQYKPDGRSIQIDYGRSSLSGILSNDLIHLGSKNVSSQTFAEMTNIPLSFALNKADGIFGLAFKSVSYLQVTPFLDNMVTQGSVSKKIFSMYFNRDSVSPNGGTLFLGGSEPKHYLGNFTYVKLIAPDLWRIEVSSVHVKGSTKDFCNSSCPTIVDTSSTTISGPSSAISEISKLIQSRPSYLPGRYSVDCGSFGKLPAVTFTIGNRGFVMKPRDYVQKITILHFTVCLTVFQNNDLPSPFKDYWTLGASFMSRFYVEFDGENNRIGFADVRM